MSYQSVNDYELLYMISDSQDDNVALLLEKYEPIICRKCVKWSSVLKKMNLELEDLEQEVRIAFIEAVRRYREEECVSFYTYINVVVDRKIYNLVRSLETNKNKALKKTSSLFLPISYTNGTSLGIEKIIDVRENLEEKIETLELEEAIHKFLATLPLEKAGVFELYLSGYSADAIATCLEKEINEVNRILRRIREKLKKYLLELDLLVV